MAFNIRRAFEAIRWDDDVGDQPLAVAELALWSATSDGEIDAGEVDAIVATVRQIDGLDDFTEDDAHALIAEMDDYGDDAEVEDRITELVGRIADPSLRRASYQLAVFCAASDGHLSDDERDFLEFLREEFEIDVREAAALAREVVG